jgi:type IV pilus biogenesis protein CpaD/CtpE
MLTSHHVRKTIIALIAALLSACASQPISNIDAIPVAGTSVLSPALLQQRPGTYAVTIKRDAGFMGGACSTRIYVDGQAVADIQTSEKVVVYLLEGDHIFSARPNGICAGGVSETKAVVKAGTPLNLRAAYGSNGEFFLNVTAF